MFEETSIDSYFELKLFFVQMCYFHPEFQGSASVEPIVFNCWSAELICKEPILNIYGFVAVRSLAFVFVV